MKKFSSVIFLSGLAFLTLSAISLLSGHQGFGLRLIGIVFLLFIIGAIFYLLELKNEKS